MFVLVVAMVPHGLDADSSELTLVDGRRGIGLGLPPGWRVQIGTPQESDSRWTIVVAAQPPDHRSSCTASFSQEPVTDAMGAALFRMNHSALRLAEEHQRLQASALPFYNVRRRESRAEPVTGLRIPGWVSVADFRDAQSKAERIEFAAYAVLDFTDVVLSCDVPTSELEQERSQVEPFFRGVTVMPSPVSRFLPLSAQAAAPNP
jgi:hypothetical protein